MMVTATQREVPPYGGQTDPLAHTHDGRVGGGQERLHVQWGVQGGVGGFLWFESRKEYFDFVGRLLAFLSPWAQRFGRQDMARDGAAIVAQVESGDLGAQEGMEALNRILSGLSQLRWWGQFKDLLDADDEFAREVRAWSRASEDGEENTSPIASGEVESFKSSLSEWGL